MFRLHASGLPADPVFPHNLKQLGYFINEDDEIRSLKNPLQYFNFFLSKNSRINNVQREAFNACIREEVLQRLRALGFQTTLLPLGVSSTNPHIPILTSSNIATAKRVILILYEHTQDLGVLAHRTLGGAGGIDKGSCVNLVKAIQALPDSPAIIIGNVGQLWFNRRQHRAMTQASWLALPQKTSVGRPPRFDPIKNTVEGNRTTQEHITYIMDVVVAQLCSADTKLDIIAVSDSATETVTYLNRNIEAHEKRLGALALCAPYHSRADITNGKFAVWLAKRARSYVVSVEPTNIALAGPDGSRTVQAFGCPIYSIGEPYYPELMLVNGHQTILDQFEYVHADLVEYGDYENDIVHTFEDDSNIYNPEFTPIVEEGEGDTRKWDAAEIVAGDEIGDVLSDQHKQAIEYMKEKNRRLEIVRKIAPNIGV